LIALWLALACARTPAAEIPAGSHYVLRGGTVVGIGSADVEIVEGRIVAVGEVPEGPESVDVSGRWIVPAFVDSHVHLAYLPQAAAMADGGVAAAVDLAAPLDFLAADPSPLRLIRSGPMVTAVGGYPTRSWGSDGYGLECADAAAAIAAVGTLADAGAGVIKLPVTSAPVLDDAALAAAASAAHDRGLKVASHALSDGDAARAAAAGADVLAHTPTDVLSEATLDAWSGRAVISTIRAFGGGAGAVANLRALRERGTTVLYGTDFGNTRVPGIDGEEIELLIAAGLDGAAILEAGTSAPAAYWGFEDLGEIAPGKSASLLILAADPLQDPRALVSPERVILEGVAR
jgi:imidazolonepropionase-like amidohydrolase